MEGVRGGREAEQVTAAAFAAATVQAAAVDSAAAGAGVASALTSGDGVLEAAVAQGLRNALLPCSSLHSLMAKARLTAGHMDALARRATTEQCWCTACSACAVPDGCRILLFPP